MADMLTIGTNATNTFKRALDVTSHNVANIGTEGYNRQRAEILSDAPGNASVGFHGGGSKIGTVQRMYADFIQTQLVDANSQKSRYNEQLSVAKQLEGLLRETMPVFKTLCNVYLILFIIWLITLLLQLLVNKLLASRLIWKVCFLI